ncbi:MAG: hypothetical protein D3916_18465, partial [Candidatus Electrothrix sp. MAN1_4]|nr:hypothetical protein [Candidatus Electrothrix sp. MAN1_4]
MPVIVTYFYALLVEVISLFFAEPGTSQCKWFLNGSFLLGWLIGLLLIRGMELGVPLIRAVDERLGELSALLPAVIAISLGASSLFLLEKQFAHDSLIYEVAIGGILGVMGGVSLNVVLSKYIVLICGVIGGIIFSMPLEFLKTIPLTVLIYAILGMAYSMQFNDMIGWLIAMATGIAIGIVVGVTNGVTFGVVSGVSYILGVLRFYFWLPELLWIFLLASWPARATAKLPWLPPQFDQLIHLPLPFMPGLIAEAYQENQVAALQSLNYLITSTNQQYVALWAIFLIAAEECRRCRTVRDISAIRDQLNWISDQEAAGLTVCLDISQDVTAALEASSPYRQAQQLDKVISKIEQRRNALASTSAREATTFGAVLTVG